MARTQVGSFNLIAAYVDVTSAREVIDDLKAAGVDAGDISLLGKEGAGAVVDRGTSDREAIGSTLKGTVTGAAAGGGVGALGGFLLGLASLLIPGVGPIMTAGIWATMIGGGALLGAQGGGFIGAIAGNELSASRSEAFETYLSQGRVLVGVHADDAAELDRAVAVCVRHQPLDLERYGTGVRASA